MCFISSSPPSLVTHHLFFVLSPHYAFLCVSAVQKDFPPVSDVIGLWFANKGNSSKNLAMTGRLPEGRRAELGGEECSERMSCCA